MNLLIVYLLLVVGVLISVAFMVLFERKILGYIQIRKGPNKVGWTGILQSFGDAIKLFIKEQYFPISANLLVYYLSPVLSLFIMLLIWPIMPWGVYAVNFSYGVIFFFCCTGFGVYTLMGSGWSSNSNYALLGAIRGVAQTISYEVSMALLFLSLIFLTLSYNCVELLNSQYIIWFYLIMFPVLLCWVASCLAETNRTPFDFAEGESELVSGFNIEYGSGGFALLFLAEYGSIIFMSYLITLMFGGGSVLMGFFIYNIIGCFFCYWFIWVRGTMPRYRYDKLMYLAWKCFLPVSLWFIILYLGGVLLIM
nr:NADH dehydrogenase subunit 1 [Cyphoderus sp.]